MLNLDVTKVILLIKKDRQMILKE